MPTYLSVIVMLALASEPTSRPADHEENDYSRVIALQAQPEGDLSLSQRQKRAQELGRDMLSHYQGLKNLSFSVVVMYYFPPLTTTNFLGSPEDWQPREKYSFDLACQPDNLYSRVTIKGKRWLTFYLSGKRLKEYKNFWNGVPAKQTETSDTEYAHLIEGFDSHLICDLAIVFRTWVGKEAPKPRKIYDNYIHARNGECLWIGQLDGADVLLWSETGSQDRDAFYLKDDLIVRWIKFSATGAASQQHWLITDLRFSNINTSREIPLSTFTPSSEFQKDVTSWKKLTEAEAIAEYRRVVPPAKKKEIKK